MSVHAERVMRMRKQEIMETKKKKRKEWRSTLRLV
jgi:hypothetical protein